MGVAVEQPGQDRPAGDVDRLVAVEPGPDVDDPAVLDRDVAVGRIGAGAVEDPAPANDDPAHAVSSDRLERGPEQVRRRRPR